MRPSLSVLLSLLLSSAGDASALGSNGDPIEDSDYHIDFHEGPVLQGSRVMALSGSVAPIVPGVGGYSVNPASAAVRTPWSRDWFDWELDGSIGTAATLSRTDFDNNGDSSFANDAGLLLSFGGGLQFGGFGAGLNADINSFDARSRRPDEQNVKVQVNVTRLHFVMAHVFFDGQLALGAGAGVYGIDISLPDDSADAASVEGGSWQLGVVWSPIAVPLRAGASVRFGAPDADGSVPEGVDPTAEGNYVVRGYVLPEQIVPPTEFHFGVATQFFRRLNRPWLIPRTRLGDERAAARQKALRDRPEPRGHLLVAAGLKVTLPVANAVGLDSFLKQEVERSGQWTSLSPRLGVEAEPWIDMLIVRAGSYLEPTRFEGGAPRLHATAGFDLHIPIVWSIFGLLGDDATFRIGGAADRADRYFGWSASIGIWR